MKNFYFVVIIKENGKYLNYVEKATDSDNLLSKFKIKNCVGVNIFPTKKKAEEIADFWNDCAKKNGNFMY